MILIKATKELKIVKTHKLRLALITKEKRPVVKNKIGGTRVNYESIGTEQEIQDRLDGVFDLIFTKMIKRRKGKISAIDRYRQQS